LLKLSSLAIPLGITYDTGGLSIKTPGSNMAGMKIDMGGSAAVLGAFIAIVLNDQQQVELFIK